MGGCQSHATVAPSIDPLSTIEQQLQVALKEYRAFLRQVCGQNPFLLTLAFIGELNAKRACIEALLMRMELEDKPHHSVYKSYVLKREVSFKVELHEMFRGGRIRITAEVARLPGMLDMVMPRGGGGGSALF